LSEEPDYKKLRKHFREETGKLDRYLKHGKIEDYFNSPKGEKNATLIEDLAKKGLEQVEKTRKILNEGK